MSISVKISQLDDGGSVASTDQIPVARGSISTFKIPANQFVINGSNVGVGTGQLFFDRSTGAGTTLQFRSLSGADGLSVSNQGSTLVISASGQNPVKTSITGNGTTRTFAIGGTTSVNPNNYRVDIDGVLQEPTADYSIVGSNIVFVDPPPNGGKVTVVSNNLVRAFDIVPSDSSVTSNKIVDQAVITSKLATDIQYSLVPTGAIMPFYRSTAPDGWLICDGSVIPTQFTTLIALVGANTPNLRGMFIRGWSPGISTTSRDPLSASRTLGSVQEDTFKLHNHTGTTASDGTHEHNVNIVVGSTGAGSALMAANAASNEFPTGRVDVQLGGAHTHTFTTNNIGDSETRPVNIALLYCIKT